MIGPTELRKLADDAEYSFVNDWQNAPHSIPIVAGTLRDAADEIERLQKTGEVDRYFAKDALKELAAERDKLKTEIESLNAVIDRQIKRWEYAEAEVERNRRRRRPQRPGSPTPSPGGTSRTTAPSRPGAPAATLRAGGTPRPSTSAPRGRRPRGAGASRALAGRRGPRSRRLLPATTSSACRDLGPV